MAYALLQVLALTLVLGLPGCADEPAEETPVDLTVRSYDGSFNNLFRPLWGARSHTLQRLASPTYADGVSSPGGASLPNPRTLSNSLFTQGASVPSARSLSDWIWAWGQFIDHDIGLTATGTGQEPFHISVPTGDATFDPTSSGVQLLPLLRAAFDAGTGTSTANPRQQVNSLSSYLDGSMVYGMNTARAAALRTKGGSGAKLLTSNDTDADNQNLLPRNRALLENQTGGHPDHKLFFLSGDLRTNENLALTATHVLLMREHNRLVDILTATHPDWTDEQLYQHGRRLVIGIIQSITYREFLPALLGPQAPSSTSTYDSQLNAGAINEFTTAGFRVGHTMLPNTLKRILDDGSPHPNGDISLSNSFFNPLHMANQTDLEGILRGLSQQKAEEVDPAINNSVRNLLFGAPSPRFQDLAAINIQRGRDHGLPSYNQTRVALGLAAATQFSDITADGPRQAALAGAYTTVDAVELWPGALHEDHVAGASVGPLLVAIISKQFQLLRDGDRFWYTRDPGLSAEDIALIESTTLKSLITRNTTLVNLPTDPFFAP